MWTTDRAAGGLFEMEAWAGHEADPATKGMITQTRSYSSRGPVGRAGGMLICACMHAFVRVCVCVCVCAYDYREDSHMR